MEKDKKIVMVIWIGLHDSHLDPGVAQLSSQALLVLRFKVLPIAVHEVQIFVRMMVPTMIEVAEFGILSFRGVHVRYTAGLLVSTLRKVSDGLAHRLASVITGKKDA